VNVGTRREMRALPKKTPWVLLALLVGGWLIFLLNAFFPVPVETVFALVGMSVFLVGMLACVVGVVWAFRTLGTPEARQASGLVAPIATIVIAFVVWSGVIASAVAVKRSLDARDKHSPVTEQTEEMKRSPNKASEATSEPAPSAGSSSPQG